MCHITVQKFCSVGSVGVRFLDAAVRAVPPVDCLLGYVQGYTVGPAQIRRHQSLSAWAIQIGSLYFRNISIVTPVNFSENISNILSIKNLQ